MELYEQNNYTIDNIQALIDNHAEEGVHLNLNEQMLFQKRMRTMLRRLFRHSLILTEELLYIALLKITMCQ